MQNVAIINRSTAPLTIENIKLELKSGEKVSDIRIVEGNALSAALASGQALKAQGLFELFRFQFCDGKLLAGVQVANTSTLLPGEAILLMHQPFLYKGLRTALQVEAGGARSEIPIVTALSKGLYSWPLQGRSAWTVGSGPSFHTAHRWALVEEFALDILTTDDSGATHRGDGQSNRQFYGYGSAVLAAAPGKIATVIAGAPESEPLLRTGDETIEAYYARVADRQLTNFGKGEAGVTGNAVVIDHGNGEYSSYMHLKPGSIAVKQGETVAAGQKIGAMGNSGNSTEPHLHFQLCDGPNP